MKIIQDTREQEPLNFINPPISIEGVLKEKLLVGDYGCEFKDGYRPPLYFERKTKADLYNTLSSGYERFKKEIIRAMDDSLSLIIVVEASESEVFEGFSYSSRSPQSIVLQLATLCFRYGIVTWFCTSRKEMERRILYLYTAIRRDYEKAERNRVRVSRTDAKISTSHKAKR